MTTSWDAVSPDRPASRRVRDEVKDGAAVVAVSATASTLLAVLLTVVTKLAG